MTSQNEQNRRTVLYDWHVDAGAKMLPFGGFEMPIQYKTIFSEHIAVRTDAGLFDISHMGRFVFSGKDAVPFLQYTTTNNVQALDGIGTSQYTLIPDEHGGAVDDAFLYRTGEDEYMLVVNAANRAKDWDWLAGFHARFPDAALEDRSEDLAMMALQGPKSERILEDVLHQKGNAGRLPEPFKNMMSFVTFQKADVILARTGYTGEPIGFEIFAPTSVAVSLWEQILHTGAQYGALPIGLGARDTLRLEAGLPLYGHELGEDPDGKRIPICALSVGRKSTSFAEEKGPYVGRDLLKHQHEEVVERFRKGGKFDKPLEDRVVPRLIRQIAMLRADGTGPGISPARPGDAVDLDGRSVGWITSGTVVPYRRFIGSGLYSVLSDEEDRRAIALAYIDSDIVAGKRGQTVDIKNPRGRSNPAMVVTANLKPLAPYARAVIHPEAGRGKRTPSDTFRSLAADLSRRAVENTRLRQSMAVNLIPSEQTPSLFVRMLSILDPAGRYAEHKAVRAFGKAARDVFYYQGTDFIDGVEEALRGVLAEFFECTEVETRCVSGQMANKAVFAALVDYTNRFEKKEPARLRYVMNHHLGRGGHLSAQYMGALHHFLRHDPETERPAVVHFPIRDENPYQIDVEKTIAHITQYSPDLMVFGKSMVLHPEPVKEIAAAVADMKEKPIILYDMAHVLGLVGGAFQQPFDEGADLVTGSTHKTFFGPQRGIIASRMSEGTFYRPLWEKIVGEVFPGDVSNHHLGTMLGLLGAAYEMSIFKAEYQRQVLANAKAFAKALAGCGLSVEGDAAVDYTETHQVILNVGEGLGPQMAKRLEENRVIVNYQALPSDHSFSDASGIRMGTQEMTRFGMKAKDFEALAAYMADIVLKDKNVADAVSEFRRGFTEMQYCLPADEDLISSALGRFSEL